MTAEAHLAIRFSKGRDGPNTLSCVRPDGSTTWSKVSEFFPVHDLTHYVVETTLGLDGAFFGLIRSGWSIQDFESPGASKRTPPEAILAEVMVGVLQREVLLRQGSTADSYNREVSAAMEGLAQPIRREVSAEELVTMRSRLEASIASWKSIAPGECLELRFPLKGAPSDS
ncbi:MAG: hypothetical protein H0U59_01145 [Gemmatimonadaceae bacterium]|nr:hypothetical protein [Gemmatimonadaceae bacterium]